MDAFQIIEALSASFFALVGIWAAVDRRHWFLRFAGVSGALLVTLLIPAYEVVIEFGLQVALIMAGVWLAHGRDNWRPRLSIETALLAMVVVAVVAAVIARVPELHPAIWAFLLTVGICTGYAGLLALWVTCGHARLSTRAVSGLLGLALFIGLFHVGHAIQHALWRSSEAFNWQAFLEFYAQEQITKWLAEKLPTIALASVILVSVLSLSRASGWFSARRPLEGAPLTRRALAARLALAALMLAVAAPLGFLLYRLATPPSMERLADLPNPNGFDDFVAAGRATPASLRGVWQLPQAARATTLEQHQRVLAQVAELVSQGLRKQCRTPLHDTDQWEGVNLADAEAIRMASSALAARVAYAADRGSPDEICQASVLLLRFAEHASRGSVAMQWFVQDRYIAIQSLKDVAGRLDQEQCISLANRLLQHDREREPHEVKEARQLIADKNRSWSSHLTILLKDWSGESTYEAFRGWHKQGSNELRLLAASLAAQAYFLEHKKAPTSLEMLVPEFLPLVPIDVYANVPLRFRSDGSTYVIYSVGPDGVDQIATSESWDPGPNDDSRLFGPQQASPSITAQEAARSDKPLAPDLAEPAPSEE